MHLVEVPKLQPGRVSNVVVSEEGGDNWGCGCQGGNLQYFSSFGTRKWRSFLGYTASRTALHVRLKLIRSSEWMYWTTFSSMCSIWSISINFVSGTLKVFQPGLNRVWSGISATSSLRDRVLRFLVRLLHKRIRGRINPLKG